ncbi:MAG: DUF3015 family protein [Nitrospiraceae bacterium]|jgi:Protein of unknown function (DUF3015)
MLRQVMVLAGALVVANAGLAFATNPDTGPGCGLGKLLWEGHANQKSIGPQALMATTNATGLNTIAITMGTSGCTNDGQIWAQHKAGVFAAMNYDNLSQEMAQGRGEHLTSLATLMGIPAERHGAFLSMTQERYAVLMQEGEASPAAFVKALNDAIAQNPALTQVASR